MSILDFRSTLAANTLLGRNTWPPKSEAMTWADVELMAALRTSDDVRLRQEASIPWNYPYMVTPVPRMISRASANLLVGEPPAVGDENDGDAERLSFIVEENGLDAELVRAMLMASSEGDVYGRVIVRPDLCDAPIIDFASRASVIPEFSGRFLTACTFVSQWQEGTNDFFRLLERHEAGAVTHRLMRGTNTNIGQEVSLDSYPRTQGMVPIVYTGIPQPLVAFIPNSIDSDPSRGFSDYRGLEQRFLALNETSTIGQKNMVLTGQKRAMIDGDYQTTSGKTAKHDTFLIRKPDDVTAGESSKPLEVLEYSFEATATIEWTDHLIDSALAFSGIAPTLVGRGDVGQVVSGSALRMKAIHSLIEASGKGRHLDKGAKKLLAWAKQIDSRSVFDGGFGRKYADATSTPSFERADMLPRDEQELAQRLVLLVNAEAISPDEKVRLLHPDWSEDEIAKEVEALGASGPGVTEPAGPGVGGIAAIPGAPGGAPRPALVLPPGGAEPGAPA